MAAWDLLNPGGHYASGRAAKKVLEESREEIASLLGAEPIEVIFTGSGTEANNIALQGLASKDLLGSLPVSAWVGRVEHPSVLETVDYLAARRLHVEWVEVDRKGHYRLDMVMPDPEIDRFVALQWANNESGTLHDIQAIGQLCAEAEVPWHVDAVQAVGHVPVDFHASRAATLAASAHKFGGPRDCGLLLVRRDISLESPIRGGGQERGMRSGTVNVAAAASTAAALRAAVAEMDAEQTRIAAMRDELRDAIAHSIKGVIIHTPADSLPGHLHFSIPGAEGDSLIMLLDMAGFECSTGSACANGVNRVSHVIMAMGVDADTGRGTLRVTLGRETTPEQVRELANVLPRIAQQARAAGMA